MEIPESISNLTTEVAPSSLSINQTSHNLDVSKFIDLIRQNVSIMDARSMEEGIAYYRKDIQSDKVIIRNFLQLYGETLKRVVTSSTIGDEYKVLTAQSIDDAFKSIECNLNTISNIINTHNKQKNILDASKISFIMLGYAIDIIKKIYNS